LSRKRNWKKLNPQYYKKRFQIGEPMRKLNMKKIVEYKGKKNDLLIGLLNRWTLIDDRRTIIITLMKSGKEFQIIQWGMDKNGEEIEELNQVTKTTKKKYLVYQDIVNTIKKFEPNYR